MAAQRSGELDGNPAWSAIVGGQKQPPPRFTGTHFADVALSSVGETAIRSPTPRATPPTKRHPKGCDGKCDPHDSEAHMTEGHHGDGQRQPGPCEEPRSSWGHGSCVPTCRDRHSLPGAAGSVRRAGQPGGRVRRWAAPNLGRRLVRGPMACTLRGWAGESVHKETPTDIPAR